MTVRAWLKFFTTLLFIGAITTVVTSFFVQPHAYEPYISPFNGWEIFGALIWFIGLGLVYSVISQMGFFAYLTLHQIGQGFFGKYWKHAQILIISFVFFELIYLRYIRAEDPEPLINYILVAAMLLVYSIGVAFVKAKETHQRAFLPAIFFMFVVTTIEWLPVLRVDDPEWLMLMIVPLLACNTYQLLKLHKIVGFKADKNDTREVQTKG
ncbi:KinB-signaling pathway activation protein [Halalkalibacillus sediminis]|uniref:KinB-signaling pathway activation protein n=1 Tax=Halalkalibacillus sediminis TaxID=2018042 RepID=A0A2I0QQE1_9BACI|nr:KinB-signaling pathway activation protein [Halalkalibacillus sediminis]PKR76537.1 KinB-signaling pathway activation protein [Halalkalibacillus sediminis]